MKKSVPLILAIFLFTTGSVSAENFKRAVLYQDMAYLTTEKTPADRKVTIDAPAELIRDSVRVVPSKGGTVKSLSIEPKRFTSGRAKQLKDLLAEKKAGLEARKRLQKTLEREIDLIFDAAGNKDKEAAFSRARMSDALSFIDARVNSLNQKHIALAKEIEDLSIEVKDLEDQLGEISRKQGYEITAELDADRPVLVSFAVRSGSWRPEYTVYANTAKGEMRIETNALIRQATGSDWEVEELSVATGRPSFGIQAPMLSPWYIGLPRYGRDALKAKVMAEAMSAPAESEAMDQDFEPEVKATAASYIIGAAGSVSLPGDGTQKSVTIQRKTLQAQMDRLTAPRADSSVFLRGESTWNGNAPILAGAYSAFLDGEFMGKGSFKETQPGEKITIDLGRDEGIKVERKEKIFHENTLTGKDKTTYAYTVIMKNTRNTPVRITLKDQIPISQDESITVGLIEASPKAAPDENGILTWTLDFSPREEKTVTFSYSIKGLPPL